LRTATFSRDKLAAFPCGGDAPASQMNIEIATANCGSGRSPISRRLFTSRNAASPEVWRLRDPRHALEGSRAGEPGRMVRPSSRCTPAIVVGSFSTSAHSFSRSSAPRPMSPLILDVVTRVDVRQPAPWRPAAGHCGPAITVLPRFTMVSQTVLPKKRRGPTPTGKGTQIGVRLQPLLLNRLDEWIERQEPRPTRPQAIRSLLAERLFDTRSQGRERDGDERNESD
jgi:hypothetical protein